MYQSFYGFREMPFNITPDPRFLYLSPTHQEALQHLKYGVQEKKGFIVLVGEVGCGKTTLCRRFLNELEFPLADTLKEKVGELQRFTPTIEALLVPDIDASLDEQPAKTRFWNAFKQLGPWWAELPPY